MVDLSADVLARLAEVTPVRVIESDAEYRDRWPGWGAGSEPAPGPRILVRPSSIAAVQAVVRIAAEARCPFVPVGGRSNVVGAIDPPAGAIVIDLLGLGAIGRVDGRSHLVRVEAGVFGHELAAHLEAQGYMLGHDPQSLELSTVGGWIATKASGVFSTGYGSIEDLVASLEVILPNGARIVTGRGPRSATGPDLRGVFLGSEGALGIVVAAWLRVRPLPPVRLLRSFGVATFEAGTEVIRRALQAGLPIAAVRLYDEIETADHRRRTGLELPGCLLIAVVDGQPDLAELVAAALATSVAAAGGADLGTAPAQAWYAGRHRCEWLEEGNDGPGRIADAIEIAADWAILEPVVAATTAAARRHADEVWYHLSHAYRQGASIYLIAFIRRGDPAQARAAYEALWRAVMEASLESGATISHHHGVGRARGAWLAAELGEGVEVLRSLKAALDPAGIAAPGQLLP